MTLQKQDWQEMPVEAVIFDMDGVLVNSEPIYFEIERSSFAHFGAPVTEEEHHGYVGVTLKSMWRQVLGKHKLSFPLEEVLIYHQNNVLDIMAAHPELQPIPHVIPWLNWLHSRQVPLAVASSSPPSLIRIIMERTGLGTYFTVRLSGEEVESGKPAPDIFLHAAKLLGAEPSSCLVIEDSRNGVKAAKSAGMRCIGYLNPGSGRQDLSLADHVITSYLDIDPIRDSLSIGRRSPVPLDLQR
ncbi:HAD family phosphatase [Paenibacillus sp. XY044]|uniref:HAD family hydrolase n=1 Tax=Paenibacillus sp. XY044 TaxID=2026089 RepID=UPI000B980703|nr:HAD family phosphatase [Paenibacillus sp. XY044]OZB90576.1 phosphatase [Paenibacillus sp. XY044]